MCSCTACRPRSTPTPRTGSRLPDVITRLMRSGQVFAELLYPISWGGRHDYPYSKAAAQFRQLYDAFGPDRFIWGSDMPNVERFCTYRQSLTYAFDHFDLSHATTTGA